MTPLETVPNHRNHLADLCHVPIQILMVEKNLASCWIMKKMIMLTTTTSLSSQEVGKMTLNNIKNAMKIMEGSLFYLHP